MGRKKEETAKRAMYSIRITEEEKELIRKNPEIKKELDKYIREYLNAYKF